MEVSIFHREFENFQKYHFENNENYHFENTTLCFKKSQYADNMPRKCLSMNPEGYFQSGIFENS
jgi:hypothetical protein